MPFCKILVLFSGSCRFLVVAFGCFAADCCGMVLWIGLAGCWLLLVL